MKDLPNMNERVFVEDVTFLMLESIIYVTIIEIFSLITVKRIEANLLYRLILIEPIHL